MPSEQYRRTCTRIGIVVLLNTLLLQVLSTVAYLSAPLLKPRIRLFAKAYDIDPEQLYYAFEQILLLSVYLISFRMEISEPVSMKS